MTAPMSGIARAIEELLAEREHIAARLVKLDEAIATMRTLFHLPTAGAPRPSAREPVRSRRANANGNGKRNYRIDDGTLDAIRKALRGGALMPGALAQRIGIQRGRVRAHLVELERLGDVTFSGATASRTVALAGAPAKEAP